VGLETGEGDPSQKEKESLREREKKQWRSEKKREKKSKK
jgi:hypothetical protein